MTIQIGTSFLYAFTKFNPERTFTNCIYALAVMQKSSRERAFHKSGHTDALYSDVQPLPAQLMDCSLSKCEQRSQR